MEATQEKFLWTPQQEFREESQQKLLKESERESSQESLGYISGAIRGRILEGFVEKNTGGMPREIQKYFHVGILEEILAIIP